MTGKDLKNDLDRITTKELDSMIREALTLGYGSMLVSFSVDDHNRISVRLSTISASHPTQVEKEQQQ